MPVYIMKRDMPYEEMVKWVSFFRKRPIGWREDQRTYMLLRAQGLKASEEETFPTLRLMKAETELAQVPDKAVPKGLMLDLMSKAKGGDALLQL